ncbi:receptor-like protein 2 [Setaria italica]|uniref:receptor-like protein 2 n=1 Tax=Setaria italica TaxID=4555 RepID=UPI000BE56AD8|nr:receptor-like protein 2 [Setaria italica]
MSSFGLAIALLLLLLLCLTSPVLSCTSQEKGSLLRFLAGLSRRGGLPASWRSSTDCCSWEGIACDGDGGAVVEVSLASRGLEGRISPALANLTGLLRLNLSHNSITGRLPPELLSSGSIVVLDVSFNSLGGGLGELPSSTPDRPLQVLNISSNMFTGMFPSTAWEKTRSLVAINASYNSFTGEMPSSFCISSPSFASLDVCNNKFSGSIPTRLGKCFGLQVLRAGQNNLSGTIPDEVFNASLLEHLSLPNIGLEGKFDGENVIKLQNLAVIDLGGNQFSGKIPDSIGQLKRLQELHLDCNNLSGELPASLGTCTDLKIVNLKGNNLNGQLRQVNFSTMLNLQVLDLMLNSFTEEIPESIYSCSNLTALRLSSNNFSGQLSPRIGNLKSLSFLSLANNSFANITNTLHVLKNSRKLTTLLMANNFIGERIPDDLTVDGFENVQILTLDGCSLSGNLPLWLSKLTSLRILDLSNNQLTGSIPAWIKNLNFLYYLDLSNNNLSGELPTALMEMPVLQSENFQDNLDNRAFELTVYIGFSGEIPQPICNIKTLQVLDLSRNHLTGEIPQSLNELNFLAEFNVSNNDLEGPVPTGGQFDAFAKSSFGGNPKLCGSSLAITCGFSADAPLASILSAKPLIDKTVFVIAFSAFFSVGVLYDQMVLSRFFG